MDPDSFLDTTEAEEFSSSLSALKNLPDAAIDFACVHSSGEEQEGRLDHGL